MHFQEATLAHDSVIACDARRIRLLSFYEQSESSKPLSFISASGDVLINISGWRLNSSAVTAEFPSNEAMGETFWPLTLESKTSVISPNN